MTKNIGQPIVRNEDLRLITGAGEFSDDRNMTGQAFAAILRSPHAHAEITEIDRSATQTMPGVLLIITGKDWQDADLLPLQNNPSQVPELIRNCLHRVVGLRMYETSFLFQ